jgi:hypothetical protein
MIQSSSHPGIPASPPFRIPHLEFARIHMEALLNFSASPNPFETGTLPLGFQRKSFRVLDGFNAYVNIEIWPVKMTWHGFLDVQNTPYRNIFKPGKFIIRQKIFLILRKEPDPMGRNMGNFNLRSEFPKRVRFHFDAPQLFFLSPSEPFATTCDFEPTQSGGRARISPRHPD